MKQIFRQLVRPLLHHCGVDIIRFKKESIATLSLPPDFEKINRDIITSVQPFTMTSPERVNSLIEAVKYVVKNKIDGAFVECGVWKGGSAMAMTLTLKSLGESSRELFLYDTFSGMVAPTEVDVSLNGETAKKHFCGTKTLEDASTWCFSSLTEVKQNIATTGYPLQKINFIEGKVEETIPQHIPKKIALLRLDTDWYESTKHELTHLFPLLTPKGVIIIDDYGHWEGARKAVDEFISQNNISILLNLIDYTGHIGIKN